VQIHYHLPSGLDLKVLDYENSCRADGYFPQNAKASAGFMMSAGRIFNRLNRMELLSLEEPRYLTRYFPAPLACLGLVKPAERW